MFHAFIIKLAVHVQPITKRYKSKNNFVVEVYSMKSTSDLLQKEAITCKTAKLTLFAVS